MQIFSDNTGRLWKLTISVGSVKRCRAELNVDLLDKEIFQELAADTIRLVDVIWLLVDKTGHPDVTDEQFADALGGDTIESAVDAFAEALFDFFPLSRRTLERAIYRRLKAMQAELMTKAATTVQTASIDKPTRDQLIS